MVETISTIALCLGMVLWFDYLDKLDDK